MTSLLSVANPVDNELIPVEVDVESDVIALLADDNPVDVEVDSDVTELLVELNPVDSELMPVEVDVDNDVIALLADDNPVDVEVDSDVTELLVGQSGRQRADARRSRRGQRRDRAIGRRQPGRRRSRQ